MRGRMTKWPGSLFLHGGLAKGAHQLDWQCSNLAAAEALAWNIFHIILISQVVR